MNRIMFMTFVAGLWHPAFRHRRTSNKEASQFLTCLSDPDPIEVGFSATENRTTNVSSVGRHSLLQQSVGLGEQVQPYPSLTFPEGKQ